MTQPSFPPSPRGACPTLDAPMAVADGLLARFRPVSGLTPAQLGALGRTAETFGNGRVEVTARGSVQVRGLSQASETGFRAALDAAGIAARTGVNIEYSPIAGEDPAETRDPRPLAHAIRAVCDAALARGPLSPKLAIVIDSGGQISPGTFRADIRLTARADGWALGGAETLDEAAAVEAVADVLARLQALGPGGRVSDIREGSEVGPASLHPSPPALLRLQSLHWSDWWLRHRLEVPQGERGAQEPRSPGSPSPLEGEGGPAQPGRMRGAAMPASISELSLHNSRTALRITLPFGQLRGEQLVALAKTMAAHGVAEARPAPERGVVLIGASKRLAPALNAIGLGAAGFSLCSGAEAVDGSIIHAADVARALTHAAPDLLDGSFHLHVSTCRKGCAYSGRAGIILQGGDLSIHGAATQRPFARLDPGAIEAGMNLLAGRIRDIRQAGETVLAAFGRLGAQ